MKKLIIIGMLLMFIVSLIACSSDTDNNKTNNSSDKLSSVTSVESEVDDKGQNAKEEDSKITFSNSYKVPGKNIVIDVPDYQEMEKGYTQLYILHGVKYVAVTVDDSAKASTVNEAHDIAIAKFTENIQNYSYVNFLSITADAIETINGIEVYKYEGTFNCALDYSKRDNAYDAYVIGYSFIMDGVPCTVTGSVIDQAQEQEMIDEIKNTVEAMIKTLRSER